MTAGLLGANQQARAADLDESYPPRPGPSSPGPAVIAGVSGGRVLDPRCRVVPQPEVNLYGDTTRFRPTLICMSRGMVADSFGPYPFYYPYYSR
jgi:hypothetical protein